MKQPSRTGATFGRRNVLRLAALAPAAAALTAACSSNSQKATDQLESLAHDARSDAALARAVAGAHPDLAHAAGSVATTRTEHAKALRQEINRLNPPDHPEPPPPKVSAPASSAQATKALSDALRGTQAKAAQLVPGLPSYRAGLTGSISASCASLLEVLA